MRVANQNDVTELYLYDEISYWGITAADFVQELQGINGDIELHINSPGGDVFEGIAILNVLRQYDKGSINTIVDGLAASAASFIAMVGKTVIMAKNSMLIIHDAWGGVIGNAADMREMADKLDKASDNIASIYADKAGQSNKFWRDVMLAETWYTDEEAVNIGLADKIENRAAVENSWDLSLFNQSKTNKTESTKTEPIGPSNIDSDLVDFDFDPQLFREAFEGVGI